MANLITIGYLTSRLDPMIDCFLRTLKRELRTNIEGVQLIVVDFYMQRRENEPNDAGVDVRRDWLKSEIDKAGLGGIDLLHIPPKPTVWQGQHKKTKNHHFAASNARNTIFASAKNDFVACVDDLSALLPGWIDNALHAKHHGYVALGSYKKVLNLKVDQHGNISCGDFPPGVDSRWWLGSSAGIREAQGSMLFGCSFAMPIEFALKVNGFDEICDGTGFEDVEFGCRLERAGCRFYYNRNMCTYESEEGHGAPGNQKFVREAVMTDQGVNSDWWIKNNRIDGKVNWTCGNDFNLRELRERILKGEPFPIPTSPTIDWRDKKPLEEK